MAVHAFYGNALFFNQVYHCGDGALLVDAVIFLAVVFNVSQLLGLQAFGSYVTVNIDACRPATNSIVIHNL